MQFIQFKIPARIDCAAALKFPKGWVVSKHKPHLTFFEIKVAVSIVEQVVAWMQARAVEIEALTATLFLDQWTVFYKRKFNIAVLSSSDPRLNDLDAAPLDLAHPIVAARCQLMEKLFAEFGCSLVPEPSTVDGLPLFLYKDASGQLLFSCSRFHRPEVWSPHVSAAIKFLRLEEQEAPSSWPSAVATLTGGLFHELLLKQ